MAPSLGGVIYRCFIIRGVCINIIEPHAHGVDVLFTELMRPKTTTRFQGDIGLFVFGFKSPEVSQCQT